MYVVLLGSVCTRYCWVLCVRGTARSCVYVVLLGLVCTWYCWVLCVRGTAG